MSESARRWMEKSPYARALGVEVQAVSGEEAKLVLPYRDANANPGRALHGGCAASLGAMGGQLVSRAALGEKAGPFHTCGLQVSYLAAAIGEDVVAEARLLRRGKQMCFVEVEVATLEGKSIAHVSSMVRGRFEAAAAERFPAAGDHGATDPGKMGPLVGELPFAKGRGLVVEHMTGGTSRISMAFRESNGDAGGGVHEGAVLALLDTTGAMASWAETGYGPYKASTPALQAQILAPPPRQDLVAFGRMVQRDADLFWSDVEVAGAVDRQVIARGTVIYRIVT